MPICGLQPARLTASRGFDVEHQFVSHIISVDVAHADGLQALINRKDLIIRQSAENSPTHFF
jgi:hypothetical protein